VNEPARTGEEQTLSVQLDLHLDRQPISGRLRTDRGADERFVGWLGFVEALKRLREPGDEAIAREELNTDDARQ
jgi:hypothetical protein